jgi:hypothetical protein
VDKPEERISQRQHGKDAAEEEINVEEDQKVEIVAGQAGGNQGQEKGQAVFLRQ